MLKLVASANFFPQPSSELRRSSPLSTAHSLLQSGDRPYWTFPKRPRQFKVRSGRGGLFHQVGRGEVFSKNNLGEDNLVHLEKHYMSFWTSAGDRHRQWEAVWWIRERCFLCKIKNHKVVLYSVPPTVKWSGGGSQQANQTHLEDPAQLLKGATGLYPMVVLNNLPELDPCFRYRGGDTRRDQSAKSSDLSYQGG